MSLLKQGNIEQRLKILRSVSIFSETGEQSLQKIACLLSDLEVPEGELIFKKGDIGNSMYIIVEGAVKIHDNEYVFAILENSQVFGEYSLLDTEARSASVTTIKPTWLLRLDQEGFYEILASEINVTKGIIKVFIKRMRAQNQLEEKLANSYVEIQRQRDEIEAKNALLEQKNISITSSINYARRIQSALLPTEQKIRELLPENFILYKPRDIVSGDFYWISEVDDKVILAVADCTGHGVPGAFMSVAGDAYLNNIVNNEGEIMPSKILEKLHQHISTALKQTQNENKDGMDIAICSIDMKNKIMEFAGAKIPITYIQNNKLFHIKGDKMPIGGNYYDYYHTYHNHIIDIKDETIFYLFTDGYQDQFGGNENKKFMIKRLKEMVYENHLRPLSEQADLLNMELEEWMGENEQIDDILLIGCKIME
jgi:serine phosphatase RsbU (regulator of sigma subunit)